MNAPPPLQALAAESERLSATLAGLEADDWTRPTRCTPWDAAALTAHLTITLARLGPMLAGPEPEAATIDAARYYRPDQRFSPAVNTQRRNDATTAAQAGNVAAAFETTRRHALNLCEAAPQGRRVRTRHGDAMTLTDFLTTRVVEVAVHGIDLADALDRPHWTTPDATATLTHLLLGEDPEAALAGLGLAPPEFIAKATGRGAFTDAERALAEAHGTTWLALS